MSGEVELLEGGAGRGEDWRKKGRLRLGGSGPVGRGKDVNGEIDWLREDRDEGRAEGVQFRRSQRDVENRTRREKEGTNRIWSSMRTVRVHRLIRDLDVLEHPLELLGELVTALDLEFGNHVPFGIVRDASAVDEPLAEVGLVVALEDVFVGEKAEEGDGFVEDDLWGRKEESYAKGRGEGDRKWSEPSLAEQGKKSLEARDRKREREKRGNVHPLHPRFSRFRKGR
jgi:hypothetical protein